MFPKWNDWNLKYTTKGLIKQRTKGGLFYTTLAAALLGAYYTRRNGGNLGSFFANIRFYVRYGIAKVLGVLSQRLIHLQSKV